MSRQAPARRHAFKSMGTTIELILVGGGEATALATFAVAEALAEEWERTFSRFRTDSELSRLNASEGATTVVSPRMFAAIEMAVAASRETGGLFDPTILPALEAWGYDRTFAQVAPDSPTEPLPVRVPGVGGIVLDPGGRRVRLARGTRIDLSGLVKGLYADVLAGLWRGQGGAVSAGGDMRLWGTSPDGGPWRVGIEDPDDRARDVAVLSLDRGGIATSGINRRVWRRGGHAAHHLIDPRTGRPARTGLRSVSVASDTAVRAEMAAKALFLSGLPADDPGPLARLFRAAVLVANDGTVRTVRGTLGGVDVSLEAAHGSRTAAPAGV